MYCKNCGNVINSGENVCSKCGTQVESIAVDPTQEETTNVQVKTPVVNNEPAPIIDNPVVPEQSTQSANVDNNINNLETELKRKNPNTVLYIVLAVVVVVAIVCLTLVITQGN